MDPVRRRLLTWGAAAAGIGFLGWAARPRPPILVVESLELWKSAKLPGVAALRLVNRAAHPVYLHLRPGPFGPTPEESRAVASCNGWIEGASDLLLEARQRPPLGVAAVPSGASHCFRAEFTDARPQCVGVWAEPAPRGAEWLGRVDAAPLPFGWLEPPRFCVWSPPIFPAGARRDVPPPPGAEPLPLWTDC